MPEPTTAKLVDKKTAAYEKQQAEVEEESRMKSLEQLAGTLLDGGKITPDANEKDGDRLQQSVKTYEQISSQLDDFYETPEKTVNSDLERKVEELNKKLEEAEKEKVKDEGEETDDKQEGRDENNQRRKNHRGLILFLQGKLLAILRKALLRLLYVNHTVNLLSKQHGSLSFLAFEREVAGDIVVISHIDPLGDLVLALLLAVAAAGVELTA